MSDNKQGYLIRSVKQKSKECIVFDCGTDYEVRVYYNGYDKENNNGKFALRAVGKDAHFYQYTKKMKNNKELEDLWYQKSLTIPANSGYLNRIIRKTGSGENERFVINRGTPYEAELFFNGVRSSSYGIVAIRRIGEKNTAYHVNKKILEDPIEGKKWL